MSNGNVQVNFGQFCVILSKREQEIEQQPGLKMKIWIFDKENDFKPLEFFYDTNGNSANSSLDDLPIEAV